MGLEIGAVVDGKYEIVRLLGEGGMGAVYEGNNTRIHRRVAIKVLHGNVAENEEAITRFEREAQAAGRIGSEHIVEVLDLGDLPGGDRYMVMEFLEGEALNDRIARGQMKPREIAGMMVDMLEGLKAAHAAGITHRDLKPDNVFLLANRGGKADFVKIVDFGISKFNSLDTGFSMTRTGAVMGTPYYMAPEQAKGGKAVDHRVDLYAVGVILYQAVVGTVPFDAETFNELLFKIVLETPPDLAAQVPGIDTDFVAIVNKAMARDPEQRFQSSEEFQGVLKKWLGGEQLPAGATVLAGTGAGAGSGLDQTALPSGDMPMATPFPGGQETGTQGAWANTGAELDAAPPPKKSATPMVLAVAAALLLAVGGGFFVLSGGEDEAAAAAAAEQEEADAKRVEEERAAVLAELEAEKQKAVEAREKAEAAREQAEKNTADAEAQAKAAAAAREAEKSEAKAAAAQNAARPRPVARPVAKPAAAPQPAPAPAPSPKPGGRPIRTDLF